MSQRFDAIVVGAGPAGYHCAIRLAHHGLKTACVDAALNAAGKPTLGGVCLNWGCIPSKALLDVSHKFHEAKSGYGDLGIDLAQAPSVDVKKMMAFKAKVVDQLTGGVQSLLKSAGVTVMHGVATLVASGQISFLPHNSKTAKSLEATHIVLAPGSEPMPLPGVPFTDQLILDSTGALEMTAVPQRLAIIGAGVIGLELGSVWSRLGAQVTLLEALDDFLPMADQQLAKEALRLYQRQGLHIELGARLEAADPAKKSVNLSYTNAKGTQQLEVDQVVVAIGRKPSGAGLLAEGCGVRLDQQGFIEVNAQCETGTTQVYAIGDAVRGPMLAHKGMEEGLMVADRIAGKPAAVNYDAVPSVIYTTPELAWVGQTEQALKAEGVAYKVGLFPFAASGRALAAQETDGRVKLIADAKTDRILGVHILGASASELITQAVIGMEFSASAEDLGLTMYAHPTLSEAIHEAALDANNEAIHIARKKRK